MCLDHLSVNIDYTHHSGVEWEERPEWFDSVSIGTAVRLQSRVT